MKKVGKQAPLYLTQTIRYLKQEKIGGEEGGEGRSIMTMFFYTLYIYFKYCDLKTIKDRWMIMMTKLNMTKTLKMSTMQHFKH